LNGILGSGIRGQGLGNKESATKTADKPRLRRGSGKSRNGEEQKWRTGETDKRKQRSAKQEETESKHRDF